MFNFWKTFWSTLDNLFTKSSATINNIVDTAEVCSDTLLQSAQLGRDNILSELNIQDSKVH